jgi:hypothetical protein
MKFDSFIDDIQRYESLKNWRYEQQPDEVMVIYIKLKNDRALRDEMKYTTMMWKLNRKGGVLSPKGSLIDDVQYISVYDWETKERIGTYSPDELKKYW